MSGFDGAGSNNVVCFLYTGQGYFGIPRKVTNTRIDPSVEVISARAFEGCKHLVKVNLCEGLLQIGSRAFCYCTSLNYLTIPSTVNRIGFEAFKGCEHLLDVKICDGLEQIGEWAFRGCKSLKRISFSSTVKRIGVGAFRGCDQLVEVELVKG